MICLRKATIEDCGEIHRLQIESFAELLEKYNDIKTNPGAESYERIVVRFKQDFTDYYLIQDNDINVGAIRIVRLEGDVCRISPMFILPEYQGNGLAQQVIKAVELIYPYAKAWCLETIKEEEKLCYLYEKMGYKKAGKEEKIQENMTIIYYAKSTNLEVHTQL